MCAKKLSLFDALQEELTYDLRSFENTTLLPGEMVAYISSRTGREAYMSSANLYAIHSLLPGLAKRYIGDTDSVIPSELDRVNASVLEFLEDNERCRQFNETNFPSCCDDFSVTVAGEVRSLIARYLDDHNGSCLNLSSVASKLSVGPGSSSGLRPDVPGDNSEYNKLFGGKISFSHPDVAGVYKACILTTRLTAVAEAVRYSQYGALDSYHTNASFLSVHKTNKKNRGICKQPSGNMALQLATHGILSDVLRTCYDGDLSTQQEKNKLLACLGSSGIRSWQLTNWGFCTVDLSSASNFPWILIKALFPELWVSWLDLIRSPAMEIAGVGTVSKHMCSSMGNGFTFALMTLLLSSVVKVLYELADLPEYDLHPVYGRLKTWGVYGDDIIVDRRVFNALVKVLAAFGFSVNSKKTFSTGPFRESCGGDYYDGTPVRPVFLKELETQADIYSLLNRLLLWSVTHSVDLPRGMKVLRDALAGDVLRVPNWEDVSAGLHVPFSMCNNSPKGIPKSISDILNKGNVAYSCLASVPKSRPLFREKSKRVFYSEVSSHTLFSYEMVTDVKVYAENVPGMLECMLGGSVRVGRYGLRSSGEAIYHKVWKIAPSWGDPTIFHDTATPLRWDIVQGVYRLWEESVRRNCPTKAT